MTAEPIPSPAPLDAERVERVAAAMVAEAARSGSWDSIRLARAALAADRHPAEEALRRVEALAARAYPVVGARAEGTTLVVRASDLFAALAPQADR